MIEIESQNIDDRRFPALDVNGPEVDTDDIVCSKCGLTDTPGNDILLCDKKGCCRAYHQNCLEPKVDPSKVGDDWFCWVCETMTNCLKIVNAFSRKKYQNACDVFPESVVNSTSPSSELGKRAGNTVYNCCIDNFCDAASNEASSHESESSKPKQALNDFTTVQTQANNLSLRPNFIDEHTHRLPHSLSCTEGSPVFDSAKSAHSERSNLSHERDESETAGTTALNDLAQKSKKVHDERDLQPKIDAQILVSHISVSNSASNNRSFEKSSINSQMNGDVIGGPPGVNVDIQGDDGKRIRFRIKVYDPLIKAIKAYAG